MHSRQRLAVFALLPQHNFRCRIVTAKLRQLFLGHFHLGSPLYKSLPLAYFFSDDLKFSFRTSGEFIVGNDACTPTAFEIDIANTHIKGVIAHCYRCPLHGRIAHGFTPVVQMIDADSSVWLDERFPFGGRGEGGDCEGVIVWNHPVDSCSILLNALLVGSTWGHAKSAMGLQTIFLKCPADNSFS